MQGQVTVPTRSSTCEPPVAAAAAPPRPHAASHFPSLPRPIIPPTQVGLMGSARELQRDLERIAARADTDSPTGLHYILQGALVL